MDKKILREFAIRLLDDENGIKEDAYNILKDMLIQNNSADINNAVDIVEGRAFIGEDIAEELLRDISKWEEAFTADGEIKFDVEKPEEKTTRCDGNGSDLVA